MLQKRLIRPNLIKHFTPSLTNLHTHISILQPTHQRPNNPLIRNVSTNFPKKEQHCDKSKNCTKIPKKEDEEDLTVGERIIFWSLFSAGSCIVFGTVCGIMGPIIKTFIEEPFLGILIIGGGILLFNYLDKKEIKDKKS